MASNSTPGRDELQRRAVPSGVAPARRHATEDRACMPADAPPAKDNPKAAFGALKACLSWWPLAVVFETALAFAEGGYKYGGHNYLAVPVRASDYVDATMRHLFQFHALGEDVDADSGAELHHITKAIASLAVLRAAMINGTWIDDRPPPAPAGFLQSLNDKMAVLAAKFPDPVARYLADGKRGPGRIL